MATYTQTPILRTVRSRRSLVFGPQVPLLERRGHRCRTASFMYALRNLIRHSYSALLSYSSHTAIPFTPTHIATAPLLVMHTFRLQVRIQYISATSDMAFDEDRRG